jgi:hypothetical protein
MNHCIGYTYVLRYLGIYLPEEFNTCKYQIYWFLFNLLTMFYFLPVIFWLFLPVASMSGNGQDHTQGSDEAQTQSSNHRCPENRQIGKWVSFI